MKINQKGLDLIKEFEGCNLKAYKLKGESYYTIGYGHSFDSSITASTVWTKDKAENQLIKDLEKFEKYVDTYSKQYGFSLNANQFSSLVSYCYNRGQGGLKQLLSNSKDILDISKNIVIYWGSATLYKNGLVRRRKAEQKLFNTSVDVRYKVTSVGLNVRKSSNVSSKIITAISKGDIVTITKTENGWGYMKEYKGWSNLRYLQKV